VCLSGAKILSWDFDSGNLALDFVNTVEWRGSDQPAEHLTEYGDLVSWGHEAGILRALDAKKLLERAQGSSSNASRALSRSIQLRELTYRIFSASAADAQASQADLASFNADLSRAMSHSRIRTANGGFAWDWEARERAFDQMLWPVIRAAADLLTSDELERLGECADDRGCGYLFIDTSKNHSRRWCSMESCGNRAKARRFYRQKQEQS
jgi:predicted RNA-binding Zn ribbon-like protein